MSIKCELLCFISNELAEIEKRYKLISYLQLFSSYLVFFAYVRMYFGRNNRC